MLREVKELGAGQTAAIGQSSASNPGLAGGETRALGPVL